MSGNDQIGHGAAAGNAAWLAACWQPWEQLNGWNAFWVSQWRSWFDALASAPNPWLPALAGERRGQPVGIDLFLPWLPRIEAMVSPFDAVNGHEAVRVMLRAVLPFAPAAHVAEWLNVDAIVTRGAGLHPPPVATSAEVEVLDGTGATPSLPASEPPQPKKPARGRRAKKPSASDAPAAGEGQAKTE